MRTHLISSQVVVYSRVYHPSTLFSNWFLTLNNQQRMQSTLKNSTKPALRSLAQIKFDNRSLQELPIDSSFIPSQREVPNAIFALVDPTPLENPKLIAYSKDVAENLLEVDLEHENLEKASRILAGCDKTFGRPAAHCYCGHQFGVFAGQLGDGATMYIGETINSKGERWEMQFKGAGLTPFSRQADGRKVLRSSIREFLCSEHLHALGIPTTRALSICTSDSTVVRDILYDGRPRRERCAVIIRVCESFLRFGSFEIARPVDAMSGRAGPNYRRNDKIVPQLYDYVTKNFYPEVNSPEEFVLEVTRRTARLVALWQTMGWCHGVLNTDNMSILGKTIDYGPFGFMERFDEGFICNRSDDNGRYAYSEQPSVCLWNCFKLLEALANTSIKFKDDEPNIVAEKITEVFFSEYKTLYRERMCTKLGIEPSADVKKDFELFDKLFKTMNQTAADFTQVFRGLAKCESKQTIEEDFQRFIAPCLGDVASLQKLAKPRFDPQQIRMLKELIDKGKAEEVRRAIGMTPEDVKAEMEKLDRYFSMTSWSESDKRANDRKLWVEFLQLLHSEYKLVENRRRQKMNSVNPRFVLRNHVAQRAITKAEQGDFGELNKVFEMCLDPFNDDDSKWTDPKDGFRYDAPSVDVEEMCAVSCSS